MSRVLRLLLSILAGMLVGSVILFGGQARSSRSAAPTSPRANPPDASLAGQTNLGGFFNGPVLPYFSPSFGGYGGYYSPFLSLPLPPPPYPYMPNHWWVSPYPLADPRQSGYNPSAGYAWESVTTLLLVTVPSKTRITLDGIYIGTTDYLGPIQLPLGEHSLRVEAAGYEPSETVLKVEEPVLQQLEVRLNPATTKPKPGPRP